MERKPMKRMKYHDNQIEILFFPNKTQLKKLTLNGKQSIKVGTKHARNDTRSKTICWKSHLHYRFVQVQF